MRNIVGSISKIDGTPASNVKIKFVLVDANGKAISNFDIGGERVIGKKEVTTDADGDFTIALWENDKLNDVSYYYVTVAMSGDVPFKAALLTGRDDISWLDFKLSGQPVTPAELDVLKAYFDTVYQPIGAIGDMLITYATPPTGYILVEDTGVDEVLYPELASILPLGIIAETLNGINAEIYLDGLLYVISRDSIYILNTDVELVETISIPSQYTGIDSLTISNGILYATTNSSAQVLLSYSNGVWTDLAITAQDYWHIIPYNNYIIAHGANNENTYEWNGTSWIQIILPVALGNIQNMQYNGLHLYANDGTSIYYTQDKITWTELTLPINVNIPTFYTNTNGELLIGSSSANGKLYIKTNITSDWTEKSIGGEYYTSQILAFDSKYFIVYQDNNGMNILAFTTDFVSFDTLDGTNQIINYYNNNVMVYNVTTDKMTLIHTKPLATNIVPSHTYIYAGIKNENSIL